MIKVFYEIGRKLNKHNHKFYTFVFLLFFFISLEIAATSLSPIARAYFFDLIEKKDFSLILYGFTFYFGTYFFSSIAMALKGWMINLIALNARYTITDMFFRKWVHSDAVNSPDNPDQRIAEDARIATDMGLYVFAEVFISAVVVMILLFQAAANRYLLMAALIYVGLSSIIAELYRKPLINNEINIQKAEAAFRRSLVEVHQGNDDHTSTKKFKDVYAQVSRFIILSRNFSLFTHIQTAVASMIPYFILFPMYFNGIATLGDVMGGAAIFQLLTYNASVLIHIYPSIIRADASWIRLIEFYNHLKKHPSSPRLV